MTPHVSPLRLLLADDHRLFRQGVRHVCESAGDIQVVAEAENGAEAVRLARERQPDVALMDIQMPLLDGVEATRQITETCPQTRVIVLTMFRDDRYVFEAVKAGAQGYLPGLGGPGSSWAGEWGVPPPAAGRPTESESRGAEDARESDPPVGA